MDFEKAYKQFEEIVKKLESENLPLSEGIVLFEKGVSLLKDCYNLLGESKGKITVLNKELDKIIETSLEDSQNKTSN